MSNFLNSIKNWFGGGKKTSIENQDPNDSVDWYETPAASKSSKKFFYLLFIAFSASNFSCTAVPM